MALPVFLVAAALTILPALGLLFYLLNRYEGYFEDARVFFALVVGFFAGLVVSFLENALFGFDSQKFVDAAGPGTAFLAYVGGYALLHAMAMTVVAGMQKFRNRKDTPYYGAALGIGFASMVALQLVAARLRLVADSGWDADGSTALVVALILAYAVASLLVLAGVGVLVARGAADGKLWRGLGQGTLAGMPHLAIVWFGGYDAAAYTVTSAVLSLAYGVGLVLWTQRILDGIVPKEIRDQVQRERRREARRDANTPDEPPKQP